MIDPITFPPIFAYDSLKQHAEQAYRPWSNLEDKDCRMKDPEEPCFSLIDEYDTEDMMISMEDVFMEYLEDGHILVDLDSMDTTLDENWESCMSDYTSKTCPPIWESRNVDRLSPPPAYECTPLPEAYESHLPFCHQKIEQIHPESTRPARTVSEDSFDDRTLSQIAFFAAMT